MAITSVGYAGTVGDAQWAEMVPHVGGAFYSVNDFASFRVTAAAGTRTVQIAGGGASGRGIYDLSSAVESRTLGSVPSGIRWDLVVLRRTWATKTSAIVVIAGGSEKALPERSTSPGTVDDQPLALVRVAAQSTAIQDIVDLRCAVHNGGAFAWDNLARSYLNQLGTSIRIGDTLWSRTTDSTGELQWIASDRPASWVTIPHSSGVVAGVGRFPLGYRPLNPGVVLRGVCQKSSGTFAVGNVVAVLPPAARPEFLMRKRVDVSGGTGSGGSGSVGTVEIRTNGNVVIVTWTGGGAPTWVSLDGLIIPNG